MHIFFIYDSLENSDTLLNIINHIRIFHWYTFYQKFNKI